MALARAGHSVRLFDTPRAGTLGRFLHRLPSAKRPLLRRLVRNASRAQSVSKGGGGPDLELVQGDLCNIADVGEAVRGIDAVIHLGAMIPPAAEHSPVRADYVNRGGTENIVHALSRLSPNAKLIYTSSIAIYGDRRARPLIRVNDEPNPGDDQYASQKLEAERTVRASNLDWTIFRLTAIVSPQKIKMDPLMFEMPIDTKLEVCSSEDTAAALARAVDVPEVSHRTFHLAGGELCRTTFRDFVSRQTEIFGLGADFLPDEAFGTGPFHCGYMDTAEGKELLDYQQHDIEDYYAAVRRRVRFRRPLLRLIRPIARWYVLRGSRFWRAHLAQLALRRRRPARFELSAVGKQGRLAP